MMKRYNIALLPLTQQRTIIELSHQLAPIAAQYQLGDSSLPHLTLYQFEYSDTELATLWDSILIKNRNMVFPIYLDKLSCLTIGNHNWVSLLPHARDELDSLHVMIANILNLPVKSSFDPHVTLINSIVNDFEDRAHQLLPHTITIQDDFKLALGECDPIGQFTRLLFTA